MDYIQQLQNVDWATLGIHTGILLIKLIAILLIYVIVRKIGVSIIRSTFGKVAKGKNMTSFRAKTLETLVVSVFTYALIFMVFVAVFSVFDIDIRGLLAGAGIVGLAIGFGAQGLVNDIVTGFFILLEKQIDVGDYITTGNFTGIVEDVELRTTKVRGFDGTLHYIPNRLITSVSNHSRGTMRALVDFKLPSTEQVEHALLVIKTESEQLRQEEPSILEGPNVLPVIDPDSGDTVLRILARTETLKQWSMEQKIRERLTKRFQEEGISLPAREA
ncbi:small-conductance mechanosensitive channel [Fictibacillus macauensis ZFHKF-1]|uniref:Small-conductance mechanosensitive channel n=1 Tax=Fictibacillus macauensis ZFHKF-1 TaxID=1196324 RepID=I8AHR6_9BACL|nr:mechanosensitive ion channel family protein [Fictibacillus macauensis]EIT84959.1 small-conductance mechanosensitive channel [Fictibacillus macauensis ZFHKF-1]